VDFPNRYKRAMPVKTIECDIDELRRNWNSILQDFMQQKEMDVHMVCTCSGQLDV